MSGRFFAILVISLATIVSLGACAPKGPVHTYKSFSGLCLSYSPGPLMSDKADSCGDRNEICDTFKPILATQHQSRQACLSECSTAKYNLYRNYPVGECRKLISYAENQCSGFCREHYPQ